MSNHKSKEVSTNRLNNRTRFKDISINNRYSSSNNINNSSITKRDIKLLLLISNQISTWELEDTICMHINNSIREVRQAILCMEGSSNSSISNTLTSHTTHREGFSSIQLCNTEVKVRFVQVAKVNNTIMALRGLTMVIGMIILILPLNNKALLRTNQLVSCLLY